MATALRCISSMATRALLAELAAAARAMRGIAVEVESVGGLDAARRVAGGHLASGSRVDLVRSGVSVAVRQGAPRPDLSSEDTLRAAVLAAPSLGYSTGPSGTALLKLFDRWGIAAEIAPRLMQAPPGVPVASLVARGDVALGFQQLSELLNVPGIEIGGPLPAPVQIVTTFSGAVSAAATQPDAARALLDFFAAPEWAALKRTHGMESAT
jgi:molybdate transport system substrate-binding protein